MSTPLVIALLALPVLVWRVWVGLKLPEKRVRMLPGGGKPLPRAEPAGKPAFPAASPS